MDRQSLSRFRWVVLGGGTGLFLCMACFVVPFHYPGPLAVLTGTAILATRGFSANRDPQISAQATGSGVGEWLRSRDWNALVYCAAVGGITAVTLYCMSRIVARVTASIMSGLGHHSL